MREGKTKSPVSRGVAKVPVIMQLEALECGAACLAMVMAYYGRWIPLEQMRTECGVGRDGSNARNVMTAARKFGMEAKGYRLTPEDLRTNGVFPCILYWEYNHFVVCCGFKKDSVVICDPAHGTYEVGMERFSEAFAGVALFMQPGAGFETGGSHDSLLSFVKRSFGRVKKSLFLLAVAVLLPLIPEFFGAKLTQTVTDRVIVGDRPELMSTILIIVSAVCAGWLVLSWIAAVYVLRTKGRLATGATATFMWKVLGLPIEFFALRMNGDIERRKESVSEVTGGVISVMLPLAMNSIVAILAFVFVVPYSVTVAAAILAAIVLNLFLTQIIGKKRINTVRTAQRDRGRLLSATVGAVEMIETIKCSGAENGYFERWAGYRAGVTENSVRLSRLSIVLAFVPELIKSVLNVFILAFGVELVLRGDITPGTILAFEGFAGIMLRPSEKAAFGAQTIDEMYTDSGRIDDVMNTEQEEFRDDTALSGTEPGDGAEESPEGELDKLTGALTMKNVSFGYSKHEPPLIENFNLELKQGQRVAFVGASGCGKSTLAKLISGLCKPWSGEILFDGKPISQIDRSVFTGSVAVVDQDIILFNDTIENNIKMWDRTIEDFEMILAARDAQIHEDIMQREGGYGYVLSEGGRDISGGERQRLEIARVLAQDPTMIIMDEATGALDARTEHEVVEAVCNRGITCIVIAHRLSTVRDCDEIIVLDHGKVVERGTHDELMTKQGAYTQLITSE